MNILLLGGCGFVGTVLTQELLAQGHQATVVDIQWFGNYLAKHKNLKVIKEDIRNVDNIPMQGIDAVMHLANIANDPCGELNSKLAWEVNVLATMRLVERAIEHKVKQFILASSGSVYGVKDEPLVTEDLSLIPISDYNKTKMISERVLMSYQDRICIQILRPATVCGYSPRMRLDLSVNMLTMQALANGKITVLGGNQTRPNIHLKDMIGVYLHFLGKGTKLNGVFNAGFENISIIDIANKVVKHVPAEIIISESNDPRSYRLCSQKLLDTGFKPRYCVDDAIKEIALHFKSGNLKNEDKYYNIKTMKNLKLQ
ncbi:MAG: SDR family oxidoreductase [Candidatus Omnitrophica bacterium]|nr:SDR family oxidoreductase [Candidatus Omnitrophota bacterium]